MGHMNTYSASRLIDGQPGAIRVSHRLLERGEGAAGRKEGEGVWSVHGGGWLERVGPAGEGGAGSRGEGWRDGGVAFPRRLTKRQASTGQVGPCIGSFIAPHRARGSPAKLMSPVGCSSADTRCASAPPAPAAHE